MSPRLGKRKPGTRDVASILEAIVLKRTVGEVVVAAQRVRCEVVGQRDLERTFP